MRAGKDNDPYALDPIIDVCGGICGTYNLNAGTLTYDPFVGVGFYVAGSASVVNASSWGGICLTYTSNAAAVIELGLGAAGDAAVGYANPSVNLMSASIATTVRISWNDFKTLTGTTPQIANPETTLNSVKFKIQAKSGSTGSFNIISVGPYNGGCSSL